MSSRATVAIVNAALEDMRVLRYENKLDRKNVMREKLRVGKTNILCGKMENVGLFCIGFDGKRIKQKQEKEPFKRDIIPSLKSQALNM